MLNAQALALDETGDSGDDTLPDIIGSLAVAESELARRKIKIPATFRFEWNRLAFVVALGTTDGHCVLNLSTVVGGLPFSGENIEVRHQVQIMVGESQVEIPCDLSLDGKGGIGLGMKVEISQPAAGAEIMTALTVCLLQSKSVVDNLRLILNQGRASSNERPFAAERASCS